MTLSLFNVFRDPQVLRVNLFFSHRFLSFCFLSQCTNLCGVCNGAGQVCKRKQYNYEVFWRDHLQTEAKSQGKVSSSGGDKVMNEIWMKNEVRNKWTSQSNKTQNLKVAIQILNACASLHMWVCFLSRFIYINIYTYIWWVLYKGLCFYHHLRQTPYLAIIKLNFSKCSVM